MPINIFAVLNFHLTEHIVLCQYLYTGYTYSSFTAFNSRIFEIENKKVFLTIKPLFSHFKCSVSVYKNIPICKRAWENTNLLHHFNTRKKNWQANMQESCLPLGLISLHNNQVEAHTSISRRWQRDRHIMATSGVYW